MFVRDLFLFLYQILDKTIVSAMPRMPPPDIRIKPAVIEGTANKSSGLNAPIPKAIEKINPTAAEIM